MGYIRVPLHQTGLAQALLLGGHYLSLLSVCFPRRRLCLWGVLAEVKDKVDRRREVKCGIKLGGYGRVSSDGQVLGSCW